VASAMRYALSRRFAADRYNLVMVARNAQRLKEISDEFRRSFGVETHWIAKDLAVPEAAQNIFDELQNKQIHVDILVNNAGFNEYGPFIATDLHQELRMIQVHIGALTALTKLFLPAMVQRHRGGILNVGSTGSFAPVPLNTVYCASKAYILSFTEALAEELRGTGVMVTALCPGATKTEFASRANMGGARIFQGSLMDAGTVAEAGYHALLRGKTRIIPGFVNKATVASLRLLPRDMVARIGRWMMTPESGFFPEGRLDARVSQDEIGHVYDRLSGMYDIWGKLAESRARRRAIDLAGIEDGQSVLEVAVGTGLAFFEIVKRNQNGRNVGIDLSTGMLSKARKRLGKLSGANYELSIGTAFNLMTENESIDLLMNCYMFDLIPYDEMDKVLTEFKRVLKKGGKLILVNMTEGEKLGSKLYDFIYDLSPKTMGGCRGVRLSEKLKSHGFTVEVREYHQQALFPSEVILARK